jgi:hypothetical protein
MPFADVTAAERMSPNHRSGFCMDFTPYALNVGPDLFPTLDALVDINSVRRVLPLRFV